jgi:hypothetical protein
LGSTLSSLEIGHESVCEKIARAALVAGLFLRDSSLRSVNTPPTGSYARRIWFLYEGLLGTELDLPPAGKGAYALVVDPDQQWAAAGTTSSRHRVENNLPGTPSFCPMIFRTEALRAFTARDLAERARAAVANVPRDLLARTAAFLLLKDSRSSFAIEGEHPPQDRMGEGHLRSGAPADRPRRIASPATHCYWRRALCAFGPAS